MKEYPSIPKVIRTDLNIYAFAKIDGSSIRCEWSPKKGCYKFGTRHQMLGEDHPIFGQAIPLIKSKYEKDLDKVFRSQKYEKAVCFFEFYGEHSEFGIHLPDDKKDVILFDVSQYKKGILDPATFVKLYGHLDIAQVLYYGKANYSFVESVRNSTLENMPIEGVVCKGYSNKELIMFKIKSKIWLNKLKSHCKDDEKLFETLE